MWRHRRHGIEIDTRRSTNSRCNLLCLSLLELFFSSADLVVAEDSSPRDGVRPASPYRDEFVLDILLICVLRRNEAVYIIPVFINHSQFGCGTGCCPSRVALKRKSRGHRFATGIIPPAEPIAMENDQQSPDGEPQESKKAGAQKRRNADDSPAQPIRAKRNRYISIAWYAAIFHHRDPLSHKLIQSQTTQQRV